LLVKTSYSQTKYEREYRIKPHEVPLQARQFVDSIGPSGKIKWYYEENLEDNSIEAKFSFRNKKYSVEFDTSGILQDIEVLLSLDELPEVVAGTMTQKLDSVFVKYTIRKIQIQYTGDPRALLSVLKEEPVKPHYRVRYEVVLKGKKEKYHKIYEITFSEGGRIEEIAEIVFKNADNLEF
jgi:hypothetical protein